MGDPSQDRKSGCGILNAMFGRWPRRTTSTGSIATTVKNNANNAAAGAPTMSSPISKRRRSGSDESAFQDSSQRQGDRIIARPGPNHQKMPPQPHQNPQPLGNSNQIIRQQNTDEKTMTKTGFNPPQQVQGYYGQGRKVPYGSTGISGELESMISDHQKSKGAGTFVRASSGNVMLFGHLGNLRQGGGGSTGTTEGGGNINSKNAPNYVQKTAKDEQSPLGQNGRSPNNSGMGNVAKKQGEGREKPGSLCRALSTRMDPEELKILGNEDYRNGNFAEALALYDAAISIAPNKASYRSNKSAALTALGRILEAVFECREAIRIEPHYQRAHNRLATLYVRLGEAEKALYHYKLAGEETDPDVMTKAKKLHIHLNKCTEAKKHRDWNTLIKETELAISAGADSAPQIFALQAETMLKLRRHGDADEALAKGPKFDVDDCTKFFGPIGNANLLIIRAQVDTAAGRFDEAMEAAQRAARLDATNKEVNMVVRRTRAIAAARSNGNDLFRAQKYSEACAAYGDGLDHDPYNSILLCNRATCRSKLGQFDKGIEDCTIALNLRPSYRKARLRRADCYAKLEKWEACIQDYELLARETPEDMEVSKALKDAQLQLNKQREEDE